MKLVLIIGPQAVGKMTVGHELEKITGLKLFHNHMSIELVLSFFDYSTPEFKRLSKSIRKEVFNEVSSSNLEGLIFTYVWYFDDPKDKVYLEELINIFRNKNAEIYFVELEADLDERIKRNKTEHRLNHKPSKKGEAGSDEKIIESVKKHRINSKEGEIQEKNYLRIDNTNLEPEVVAQKIKDFIYS